MKNDSILDLRMSLLSQGIDNTLIEAYNMFNKNTRAFMVDWP